MMNGGCGSRNRQIPETLELRVQEWGLLSPEEIAAKMANRIGPVEGVLAPPSNILLLQSIREVENISTAQRHVAVPKRVGNNSSAVDHQARITAKATDERPIARQHEHLEELDMRQRNPVLGAVGLHIDPVFAAWGVSVQDLD
ncbi:hypothetical protein GQ54DRAFT_325401 [Martensiomyces pterosporus]|nr:hypothetical protein GQ54DRAFT_325401 [Martensiomyces pterosporus]